MYSDKYSGVHNIYNVPIFHSIIKSVQAKIFYSFRFLKFSFGKRIASEERYLQFYYNISDYVQDLKISRTESRYVHKPNIRFKSSCHKKCIYKADSSD